MLGSTLYLVGIEMDTKEYVKNVSSCSMCKRMIINAGITKVVFRDTKNDFRVVETSEWITDDESIIGKFGY